MSFVGRSPGPLSDSIPGGFVISARPLANMEGWRNVTLGSVRVYLTQFNQRNLQLGGERVLILGDVFYSPSFEASEAASQLEARLANSMESFLSAVKGLSGRFAILFEADGRYFIVGDAGAFQPVFYSDVEPLAASHDAIIPCVSDLSYSDEYASITKKWGFPGDISRFRNIYTLIANHRLSLDGGNVERFALTAQDRVDVDSGSISERIVRHIRKTVEGAASLGPLYMGLTGGLDSRLTLAAIIDLKDKIQFFTYNEGISSSKIDIDLAKRLATAFGLRHKIVQLIFRKRPGFDQYLDDFRFRNLILHNVQLPFAYYHYFDDRDGILIRSNYFEAIRADIQRRSQGRKLAMNDSKQVAAYYDSLANKGEVRPFVRKCFEDYFARNETTKACKVFDPWDVFFTEHRMTTWMGQVISGTDYAFRSTCVPINSHELISQVYSIDASHRSDLSVFAEVFEKYLPGARDIPFAKGSLPQTR